jgi:hypothetical protein
VVIMTTICAAFEHWISHWAWHPGSASSAFIGVHGHWVTRTFLLVFVSILTTVRGHVHILVITDTLTVLQHGSWVTVA